MPLIDPATGEAFLSAADEIHQLRAENERLQIELKAAQTGIGALQGTVERLRLYIKDLQINSPAQDVINENERLRARISDLEDQLLKALGERRPLD